MSRKQWLVGVGLVAAAGVYAHWRAVDRICEASAEAALVARLSAESRIDGLARQVSAAETARELATAAQARAQSELALELATHEPLRATVARLSEDTIRTQARNLELQTQIADLVRQFESRGETLSGLRAHVQAAETQQTALAAALAAAQAELVTTADRLRERDTELATMRNERAAAETLTAQLQTRTTELTTALAKLALSEQAARTRGDDLQKALNAASVELDAFRHQISLLQSQ